MDPGHWQRIRELFDEACELPVEARRARVEEASGEDRELCAAVLGMLAADAEQSGFLRSPARGPARAPALERLGSYRIEQVLATGGFSTVYSGVQERPQRKVAIKVLRSAARDADALRRFRLEAEVLGHLRHPAIAQVIELGVHEPEGSDERWPWIAMEFVEGATPIDEHARRAGLDLERTMRLFLEVCDAVHHGHLKGIIHRDLKPANVLVDASGRPKLIDFGLARVSEGALSPPSQLTEAGAVLGTIPYMSPEQFGGGPGEVDARSDVYALGAILYELVCGRRPLDPPPGNLLAAARTVTEETPPPASSVRAHLPRELDWILARCLEKRREDRYQGVAALVDDLLRMLSDQPVVAGPPSRSYRLRKFLRRHRAPLAAAAAVFAALAAGLVLTWREKRESDRLRGLAEDRGEQLATEVEKLREIQALFEGALEFGDPSLGGAYDAPMSAFLERLDQRLSQGPTRSPDVEAALRRTLGVTYYNLGMHARSEEQVRAVAELLPGLEHPETFDSWELDYAQANAELQREAVGDAEGRIDALAERALGRSATDRGRVEILRYAVMQQSGRYPEALAAAERAEEFLRSEERRSPDHLAAARIARADAMGRTERTDESVAAAREAVAFAEGDAGCSAATRCQARETLGILLLTHGRPREARDELELALRIGDEEIGATSPLAVQARRSLAMACDALGDHDRAQEILREALAHLRELGEADGPVARLVEDTLVRSYGQSGRSEAALALVEEALPRRRAALPARNPARLELTRRAAQLQLELGRPSLCLDSAREIVQLLGSEAGPEHAPLLFDLTLDCAFAGEAGAAAEAALVLRDLDPIVCGIEPRQPALIAELRLRTAEALLRAGEPARCLELTASELARDEFARELTPWRLRRLSATAQLALGEVDEAMATLEECLAEFADAEGSEAHVLHVAAARQLALALERDGQADAAELVRREVLERRAGGPTPLSWDELLLRADLAGGLRRAGRTSEALEQAGEAAARARALRRPGHPQAARIEFELGRCLLAVGEESEGARTLRSAFTDLESALGDRSAEVAALREELASLAEDR